MEHAGGAAIYIASENEEDGDVDGGKDIIDNGDFDGVLTIDETCLTLHEYATSMNILPFLCWGYFRPKLKKAKFLKNIYTLSCWYSLDSSCGVLLNEYTCVMVSVIFYIILCWPN